jgi:hypothetical protein
MPTRSVDYTEEIVSTSATNVGYIGYTPHVKYDTANNVTWGNWETAAVTQCYSPSLTYLRVGVNWTGEITGNNTNELFINGNGTIKYNPDFNKYFAWSVTTVPTKNSLFTEKLKSNLVIVVKSRVETLQAASPAERVALETLREFISESEFRKYLRYGFVLVKGKSGDTFQVFRNRSHTKVWRNGQVVEEVCVRIQNVPPTDSVIAFRNIIQSDEEAFRKLGNVYRMKKAA